MVALRQHHSGMLSCVTKKDKDKVKKTVWMGKSFRLASKAHENHTSLSSLFPDPLLMQTCHDKTTETSELTI